MDTRFSMLDNEFQRVQNVIEYSASQQARLFTPLGLDHATPAVLVIVLFAVTAVVGAVLFPIVLRIRGPGRRDPVQRLWQLFQRRLEAAGVPTSPAAGPKELADTAAAVLPRHAGSIRNIAGLYTQCRYAPGPPPFPALQEAVRVFRPTQKHA